VLTAINGANMTQISDSPPRVLYLARGNAALYEVARAYAPSGIQLVTLDSDDPQELFAKIVDCEAVIVGTRKLTRELIQAAPKLRLVVHQGVGYHDTMDVPALQERRIPCAVTPNGTPQTVSEHAIMLMLAACRRLPFADAELRQGRYHVNALRLESQTIAGKTVGFIGMGRIGQATARRLLHWETSGLYVDPVPVDDEQAARLNLTRVSLPELLERADIVSLHVPLTPDTRAMIDAKALARMKRGSVLVNTARGPVVDERALVDALRNGHLGAAGIDVYEQEPVPAGHPLAEFKNVVLTPHISAATRDTFAAKMQGVFANISRFYSGAPLQDQVF
jgi:phosphoglycerate dehydrogenase-like enzyme